VEEGLANRFTLPENPLTLVKVMIVCFSEPDGIACEVGLSDMEKSPGGDPETVTVMIVL
jgi:hypothetical protein